MSAVDGGASNRFAGRAKQVEDPTTKALRIKVSGLKRNLKDLEFAKKEVVRETERLESIKQNDPDRVKQQENVLGEAQMMIPHSENRVRAAIKDLKDFLQENDTINRDDELVESAHQILKEGSSVLSQE
ncbi:tubulin binding cofactor A-like protein [Trypanosoma grayi]|uniref:tubulin binding cofactor A-like protein n=1 Tax=Trypanosoma grayi TaxID=71804 RepID=UPI0004F3F1CD|nr:tubulin binding cofactor A-like protein [Trypanosoma grayi]KEG08763.1 tubulin binding cofactor A-like protein [Trypanosoma grayi]